MGLEKKGTFISEIHKHFTSKYKYTNDLELLNLVVNIYAIVELGETLTNKQRVVLRSYLKNGYNDVSKKAIMLENNMDAKYIDQVNFILTKKGFLEKHPTNYRMKVVNKRLIELKKRFLSQDPDNKAIFYTIFCEKNSESNSK
jgi:hypothetical protein